MAFIAAAAVLGAAAMSSRASGKAADAASEAAQNSALNIKSAGDKARLDILDLFPASERQLIGGASAGFDILGQGIGAQQQALSQGNLNAQRTVGGGFDIGKNALLGLPTNTQGFAPQGVDFTQVPQNPFQPTDGAGGAVGSRFGQGQLIGGTAPTSFQTGQGGIQGGASAVGGGRALEALFGNPQLLNSFASALDQRGALIRNPDGSTGVDFSKLQDPGSAAIMSDNQEFRSIQDSRSAGLDFRDNTAGKNAQSVNDALLQVIGAL